MTLQQARVALGINPSELAREAGVKRTTIVDIEAKRNLNPSHVSVTKIIRALHRRGLTGVTAEEIFPVPDDAPTRANNAQEAGA